MVAGEDILSEPLIFLASGKSKKNEFLSKSRQRRDKYRCRIENPNQQPRKKLESVKIVFVS